MIISLGNQKPPIQPGFQNCCANAGIEPHGVRDSSTSRQAFARSNRVGVADFSPNKEFDACLISRPLMIVVTRNLICSIGTFACEPGPVNLRFQNRTTRLSEAVRRLRLFDADPRWVGKEKSSTPCLPAEIPVRSHAKAARAARTVADRAVPARSRSGRGTVLFPQRVLAKALRRQICCAHDDRVKDRPAIMRGGVPRNKNASPNRIASPGSR